MINLVTNHQKTSDRLHQNDTRSDLFPQTEPQVMGGARVSITPAYVTKTI